MTVSSGKDRRVAASVGGATPSIVAAALNSVD
jgi:hypothetical protein